MGYSHAVPYETVWRTYRYRLLYGLSQCRYYRRIFRGGRGVKKIIVNRVARVTKTARRQSFLWLK